MMSRVQFAPLLCTPRLTLSLYNREKDAKFAASLMGPAFTVDDLQRLCDGTLLHRSVLSGHTPAGESVHVIHLGTQEGPQIGLISLCQRKEGFAPDIGWAVLPDHQGKGIATEAAKEALRYWHEEIGIKEICALTSPNNIASWKVAEHIGFVKKGSVTFKGPSGGVAEELVLAFESMKEFTTETVLDFWGEPEVEVET